MERVSKVVKNVLKNDTILIPIDLSDVSVADARKQYVNFKLIRLAPGFGSRLMSNAKNPAIKLNENYNTTVPLQDVQKEISKIYSLQPWQFNILLGRNNIEVCLIIPSIDENVNMMVADMENLGYNESCRDEQLIHNLPYIRIQFEPLYTDNVYNDVKNMGVLYHITPEYNVEKIKKYGFVPKSDNSKFKYLPRVYFIKGDTPFPRLKAIARSLCAANTNPKNNGKYAILYIDTDMLLSNIRFQYDPLLDEGVYICDSIPYDCVYNIKLYDVASE